MTPMQDVADAENYPPPSSDVDAMSYEEPSPNVSKYAKSHQGHHDSPKAYDSSRASKTSSISQTSSLSGFPNKKAYIGPWQLGKTLGKGSSARVRAARHRVTGLSVAVKIVAKETAKMTQAGSIAKLDELDNQKPTDRPRMPLSLEREVAILKLIDHKNIVQLHDIWENRDEM